MHRSGALLRDPPAFADGIRPFPFRAARMNAATTAVFTTRDGTALALRHWEPDAGMGSRGTIVIAHGLGEHAGRYTQLAGDLTDAGWTVLAADHRGHGATAGPRGVIPHEHAIRDDLLELLATARRHHATPVILLGHSMGGAFAAASVMHDPSAVDALVLSSPALRAHLTRTQAIMLKTMLRFAPQMAAGNGVNADLLSHDRSVVSAYNRDPLVHDRVSARLAQAIISAGEHAIAGALRWRTPTLLVYAGADQIVDPSGSAAFASAAPADLVTSHRFDSLYHEIFNETGRAWPINTLLKWLDTRV
jgi:alpha-beta hydrolase superfamily lysophospholipase